MNDNTRPDDLGTTVATGLADWANRARSLTGPGDSGPTARDACRASLAEEYGPGYAAVIVRAGQLQKTLTVDNDPRRSLTPQADLIDANVTLGRARGVLMLDGMRTAAAEILTAEPHNQANHPAQRLANAHINRMCRAIMRDTERPGARPHGGRLIWEPIAEDPLGGQRAESADIPDGAVGAYYVLRHSEQGYFVGKYKVHFDGSDHLDADLGTYPGEDAAKTAAQRHEPMPPELQQRLSETGE